MTDDEKSSGEPGWQYQGRQQHGWFGSGTKPKDDSQVVLQSLESRIRTLAATAVAGVPANKRFHRGATFGAAETERLVRAMSGWVLGLHMLPAEFASRFIGRHPQAPVVHHLYEAAERVANARTHADMRAATDALAAGMVAIGLDRWPRELVDLAARADSEGAALRAERYRTRITISQAPSRTAAINFNP